MGRLRPRRHRVLSALFRMVRRIDDPAVREGDGHDEDQDARETWWRGPSAIGGAGRVQNRVALWGGPGDRDASNAVSPLQLLRPAPGDEGGHAGAGRL